MTKVKASVAFVIVSSSALTTGLLGCGKPTPYNPERSAELLQESDKKLKSTLSQVQLLKEQVAGLRAATRSIGKFPWEGWTIEPGTRILISSPTGKKYTYTFAKELKDFSDWDEMGDWMVKRARQEPSKSSFAVEFGGREQTSEEAGQHRDIFSRLREPVAGIDRSVEAVEKSIGEARVLSQRATDLLPLSGKAPRIK